MNYVDGFVLVVAKKNLPAYRRLARAAGRVWRDHGALEYRECVGDDLRIKGVLTFLKLAKTKRGETVLFSWIAYKSRAHRDKVNTRVMADPRLQKLMKRKCPFDPKRMSYGGFKAIVEL